MTRGLILLSMAFPFPTTCKRERKRQRKHEPLALATPFPLPLSHALFLPQQHGVPGILQANQHSGYRGFQPIGAFHQRNHMATAGAGMGVGYGR